MHGSSSGPPIITFSRSVYSFTDTGLPRWLGDKESTCHAADMGSIPGLGRSPAEANRNSLQYFCWENPKDRGARRATVHGVAKSWTRLKRLNDVRWMVLTKHTVVIISQYVFSWPLNSMGLNCCSLIHSKQMGPLIHRLFSTNTALVISFFTSLSVGKSLHLIRDRNRWHPKN